MEYLSDINRAIKILEELKERIRKESVDWWWLNQGDGALLKITKIEIINKKFHMEETPKISVRIAINMMMEQLQKLAEMYKEKKLQEAYNVVLKTIEEDLYNIASLIKNIREAHEVVQQLESLRLSIDKSDIQKEKKNELTQVVYGAIDWIKEIIMNTPREWEKKKKKFENIIRNVKKELKNNKRRL